VTRIEATRFSLVSLLVPVSTDSHPTCSPFAQEVFGDIKDLQSSGVGDQISGASASRGGKMDSWLWECRGNAWFSPCWNSFLLLDGKCCRVKTSVHSDFKGTQFSRWAMRPECYSGWACCGLDFSADSLWWAMSPFPLHRGPPGLTPALLFTVVSYHFHVRVAWSTRKELGF
jgi:hypothetical protein